MKIAKLFLLAILALSLGAMPLRAQWNQNTSIGPFTYTDPANWAGGVVSNVFSIPPISGLTLQFTGDYVLTNGVMINFPGSSNVTFQSDGTTLRTLHLSLGNFVRTNNNGGTITIGTNSNPLAIDLYGSTRTIGGGAALSTSSSLITTLNIGAQIIDSSGKTNAVIIGGGNTYAYLLNTNSSFLGPVTFQSLRGGGFASIKPVGGGASALGAPLDASNGTITVSDGGSFGQMKYLGTGDTSDRNFIWNITDYHTNASWGGDYLFANSGTGPLKLSGQWLFPTNRTTSSELVIAAATAPIEFAGYINGTGNANGTFTYPLFYGNSSTNRITLSGPTNTFKDFYVSNLTLAFNTAAPAGSPSSLGAGTNSIFLDGGSAGWLGWVGGSGQGSSLQYYGPSAIFTRNVQFNGGGNSFYWALDNAGTNTALTWSNNIYWNLPAVNFGFDPRYLFINPSITSTNIVTSLIPDANISVAGIPIGVTVAAASPAGTVVNNGGVVELLNPSNSFAGGIQSAYARTIQAATLADIGTVSSIGTGLNPYLVGTPSIQLTGINLGSTDSQRGGIFSYIGTNSVSSDQQITILGSSGVLCSGTVRNDSPNNSSLHLTYTGTWSLYSVMPKCLMTLGGSAQAVNTLDNVLPDVPGVGNSGSLLVNGSMWRLTAAETYTATTGVANATLILDGSVASGAGMSVGSGGLLTGTGTVNEAVSIVPGGSIGAGDGGIGTLTIAGNLTNSGTLTMKISKLAGTNDQIVLTGGGSLTYGGGLTVTNLGGTLALNDTFTLFVAGSYIGSITSSNLPPLASGLAWNTSGLTNNGSITVVAGPPATPPVITGESLIPGNLVLKGTNGSVNGTFYVVTTTNLTTPMTNWTYLFTNQFDGSGNFNVTNPYTPQWPASFFRIKF
ncbi:MAG TPA: hypothetical protein VK742_09410 [Candidatus Sulfotelmatobacter sp.]|nr:hypothetical protein [Candidatus Sulfotelmatobacter sp.]